MEKMKKILGATMLAALLGTGGASAADIYPGGYKEAPVYVAPPVWTGFYIGGHMGIAWTNVDLNRFDFCDLPWDCTRLSGDKLHSTNGFGGGQFGYNWQTGTWVFGIEVDLGAVVLNNRSHFLGQTPYGTVVALDFKDDQAHFAGDVTGRLGWTWGSALIYAKGGFAFFDVNRSLRETVMGCCVFDGNNNNDFLTGWTIGGGIEWKVSPTWSFKVEYLHFDFTNLDFHVVDQWGNVFHNDHDLVSDTIKLGVNYHFVPFAAPLK